MTREFLRTTALLALMFLFSACSGTNLAAHKPQGKSFRSPNADGPHAKHEDDKYRVTGFGLRNYR